MVSPHLNVYTENCAFRFTDFDLFDKNIYLQWNKREIFDIDELDLTEIKPIKYISRSITEFVVEIFSISYFYPRFEFSLRYQNNIYFNTSNVHNQLFRVVKCIWIALTFT